jgi:hypothetical protein
MTDDSRASVPPVGRIDLRAIEVSDGARSQRVISAAMARIATSPTPVEGVLDLIGRYSRAAMLAAAAIVAIAVGTIVSRPRAAEPPDPVTALAGWADSRHVPTNGELLAEFQGYGR